MIAKKREVYNSSSKSDRDQRKAGYNMKTYYIHTFATEDKPEMTVGYSYTQFKEIVAMLNENNIEFTTWHD